MTGIEWCDKVWNPMTGCDWVSAGCDNCYARSQAAWLKEQDGKAKDKYQNDGDPRTSGPGFDYTEHPEALDIPRHMREPKKIFVNSMSDFFHVRATVPFQQAVFQVMAETPRHSYQILTKRSRHMRRMADRFDWLPNVWLGVSVEDASQFGRVDDLRAVPAAVRFLSCEPLLGPLTGLDLTGIGWVIVGGESGTRDNPAHRPIDPDWVREIRDQCLDAGVPFFFKQWGGRTWKSGGKLLDGRTWTEFPGERS